MKITAPNLQEIFDLPNPGLRAYFTHNVQGSTADIRPPFWKGHTRAQVLEMWQRVYDTLAIADKYPTLNEFEMEMKAKVGPMSIQLPLKDRIPSIESYYTLVEQESVPISDSAIKAAISYFRANSSSVRMKTQPRVIDEMRLSTNAGAPYFTKRRRVVAKTVPCHAGADMTSVYPSGDTWPNVAILGWRGQEGGIHEEDVKQRVVWMYPFALNVQELQMYQPLITAMQKRGVIPAYVSMEAVDQAVTDLWRTKSPNQLVVCTDFTAFDQHFNQHMQDAAQSIIRGLVASDIRHEEWFASVFPQKYNIPLVCSEDVMYTGSHGMGSGSGGTNFDECMAHRALQYEAAQLAGQTLNPYSMAYGDDGILTYPGITVEQVTQAYRAHGQEMNVSKQYASAHDCVVLRRWHSDSYRDSRGVMVGVYSTFRALGRLLAQERWYDPEEWGPIQVTLRAWSILENCKHSPAFEPFVDFVMETGDKYRLGLEIPGFMDNIGKYVRESIDHLPDFLGYTKTQQVAQPIEKGIREWRVYQYLKSKA